MEIKKNIKAETQTWNNYDFAKPSLAVVAYGIRREICVISSVGAHVNMELDECGSRAEDFLTEPEKSGIWIWEGIGTWHPGTYDPTDGETVLEGTYRKPTIEEWVSIMEFECPWNDEEWKLKEKQE